MTKKAFTLSEVLVTLCIIGVVAAMTIPTVLNNAQDAQLKTTLKKTLSDISNATQQLSLENPGQLWDMPDGTTQSDNDTNNMLLAYKKYLSILKSENMGCTYSGSIFALSYKLHKSSTQTTPNYNNFHCGTQAASLNNGQSVIFMSLPAGPAATHKNRTIWGEIRVDVNGPKVPNEVGKDLFTFLILKNTDGGFLVVPAGGPDDTIYLCTPNDTYTFGVRSAGCTYYVINDLTVP